MGRQRAAAGEEYVVRSEAAKMLEVTPRTLTLWSKQGRLKPYRRPGIRKTFFLRTEVQSIMLARADKSMDLWKVHSVALAALSTAQRAERRLTELLEQLGLDADPLPRDPDSILSLYAEAQKPILLADVQDAANLQFWTGVFFNIDEVYLELVQRATGNKEPWKAFIDFANGVTHCLVEKGYHRALARAVQRFDAGKRNLLHASYMYCRRTHGQRVAGVLFDGRASAVDELMAILH